MIFENPPFAGFGKQSMNAKYDHAYCLKPLSAGTDFRRQNPTSVGVRFSRLKSIPALKEYNIYNEAERDIFDNYDVN